MISRAYDYIGPDALRGSQSERHHIQQPQDVKDWMAQTGQCPRYGMVVVTFIVDTGGQLWIADRHSEHVACAIGQPVLSAGEMTFAIEGKSVAVTEVSNQSLGYCPEPASWPAVSAALKGSGLSPPLYFTSAYTMRICEICKAKNIIKDDVYECGVCQSVLPIVWNFGRHMQSAQLDCGGGTITAGGV